MEGNEVKAWLPVLYQRKPPRNQHYTAAQGCSETFVNTQEQENDLASHWAGPGHKDTRFLVPFFHLYYFSLRCFRKHIQLELYEQCSGFISGFIYYTVKPLTPAFAVIRTYTRAQTHACIVCILLRNTLPPALFAPVYISSEVFASS